MKKIVRLTESDLVRLVKRVINEQGESVRGKRIQPNPVGAYRFFGNEENFFGNEDGKFKWVVNSEGTPQGIGRSCLQLKGPMRNNVQTYLMIGGSADPGVGGQKSNPGCSVFNGYDSRGYIHFDFNPTSRTSASDMSNTPRP